jgi:hypothetical protein
MRDALRYFEYLNALSKLKVNYMDMIHEDEAMIQGHSFGIWDTSSALNERMMLDTSYALATAEDIDDEEDDDSIDEKFMAIFSGVNNHVDMLVHDMVANYDKDLDNLVRVDYLTETRPLYDLKEDYDKTKDPTEDDCEIVGHAQLYQVAFGFKTNDGVSTVYLPGIVLTLDEKQKRWVNIRQQSPREQRFGTKLLRNDLPPLNVGRGMTAPVFLIVP